MGVLLEFHEVVDVDAFGLEVFHHALQLFVLLLQLPDEFVTFALVDDGVALDLLGLVCVAEGGESLFVVVVGRRDGADHEGLAVAAQGVLQDAGEHTVSVGSHVLQAFPRGLQGQVTDHAAQHVQGLVDRTAFFHAVSRGSCFVELFAAGQVDQVDHRDLLGHFLVLHLF